MRAYKSLRVADSCSSDLNSIGTYAALCFGDSTNSSGKKLHIEKQNLSVETYLSVNRRDCCHLDIEHSFVIIHPLHAWELNLSQCDIQFI